MKEFTEAEITTLLEDISRHHIPILEKRHPLLTQKPGQEWRCSRDRQLHPCDAYRAGMVIEYLRKLEEEDDFGRREVE